jgi:hypothetical protein
MHKRPSFIVLLIVGFLFSAWSNVIAAAFCPRYGTNRLCLGKQVVSRPKDVDTHASCHHEVADMEMDDVQMETEMSSDSDIASTTQSSDVELSSSNDQVALELPIEQCLHCWSHSQPTSGSVSLVATDSSKPSVVTDLPLADLSFALPSNPLISIIPTEHGPPGNSFPRHVLINVFRI